MFVQLLKTTAGPAFTGAAGKVYSVDDAHGRQLVADGTARKLTDAEYLEMVRNPPDLKH